MDLSIIIVSWNTHDLLAQCIESIYAYPPDCEFEVWVVDNASTDGSATMVRERFPQVRLIENRENVGFARANNQAIRESAGKYILLLNSDTIVQLGALQNMVAFMEGHSEAGIVGAYLLNLDGTPQPCFGNFPTILSETVFAWGLDSRLPFSLWSRSWSPFEKYRETDWVQGAALMIRRDVVSQAGGMDESYFMYSEEIDLAYRAKQTGWRIYVLRTAPVIHLGQQSTAQIPVRMKVELFRSKGRYFKKHRGAASAWLLRFVFASSILARRVFYGLTGNQSQRELWTQAWQQFVV